MIFVFNNLGKLREQETESVELLLYFEDNQDFVSYMKEHFDLDEGFESPNIGFCGMKIQDSEFGILQDKDGNYPEEVIVVNTDYEIRREDPLFHSFYEPFLDYITIFNRDNSIDNLLDND